MLLTLAFLFWLQTSAPTTAGPVIAGTVVDSQTKAPLARALVTITPAASLSVPVRRGRFEPPPTRSAITQADGRFGFLNVPPGKYHLSAELPGQNPQGYLAHGQYSTAIVTGPGLDTTRIVFPYTLGGNINGTVTADNGEPVGSGHVALFAERVVDGRKQITTTVSSSLNPKGQFRFSHLAPGTYFIAVSGRPWYHPAAMGGTPDPELDVGYPFTYYGGTTDFHSASPIVVANGSTVNANIAVHPVRNVHLKLSEPGKPGFGQPIPIVHPLGPDGSAVPSGFAASSQGVSMPPGQYSVELIRPRQVGSGSFEFGQPTHDYAARIVDISSDQVLDVSSAGSAVRITGVLVVEGEKKPRNKPVIQLRRGNLLCASTEPKPDGSFSFEGELTPGRYRIVEQNTPEFYVQSLAAKGAEMRGDEFDLPAGSVPQITVTLAPAVNSSVVGRAVQNGAPVAGAFVLLVPDGGVAASRPFPRDQSDFDGSFQIRVLSPGRYKVIALEGGDEFPYREGNQLAQYLPGATAITINEHAPGPVDVEVQKRQ